MSEICAVKINKNLTIMQMEKYSRNITKENRDRVALFRRKEDKIRTIYGELLARYMISELCDIPPQNIVIERDEKNKPFLVDIPLYFNISHSGDYVICAIDDMPVGADIEEITETEIDSMSNIFSEEENYFLKSQPKSVKTDNFFLLWTAKESYVKMLGTGLYTPFDSFSVSVDTGVVNGEKTAFFKSYEIKGYRCALCSERNCFPEKIRFVSDFDILKLFS